jgi:hypothetical protein
MPKIEVFAGSSIDGHDEREPSSYNHGNVADSEVADQLFRIGMEYKLADYFPNRQVVIVINPDPTFTVPPEVKQKIRAAAQALEDTGQI